MRPTASMTTIQPCHVGCFGGAAGLSSGSGVTMRNRALFLDRDGTLVYPRHYPSRPEELIIYEGVPAAVRRIQGAGFLLVLITNQAGLARGLFSSDDLGRMHRHLADELEREGVRLDGVYHCPHHPEGVVAELAVRCDCRKPAPGMLLRAAEELEIDLGRSWFLGDILDDVEAGNRAGCRTVLVDLGTERPPASEERTPDFVAGSTLHALGIVAACEGLGPEADLAYLPGGWPLQRGATA
jgi:D-glycero-D-manno-heptose 1,7-bisphosphate phosphatase